MNANGSAADGTGAFAEYEPYGIVPDDWWDRLRQARQRCPVAHSAGGGGFWLVTRSEDVAAILRSPRVFSSTDGITIPRHPDAPPQPPLDVDPPLHGEFRRLMSPFFSPAAVARFRPAVAALARELVLAFASAGSCDFLNDYARPLSGMVLGRFVLGI